MNDELLEAIQQSVNDIQDNYYKLKVIKTKSANVNELCKKLRLPYINVNLQLSLFLMKNQPKNNPLTVQQWINNLCKDYQVVVLDYFELLYKPSLKLQPISLMRNLSKYNGIILVWRYDVHRCSNGKISLIYANPNHSEYQIDDVTMEEYMGEDYEI